MGGRNGAPNLDVRLFVTHMRPRWVDDDRTIKADRVGYTVIAKWRPWLYYRVITFRMDGGSQIQRMISSLDSGLPVERAPRRPDSFATVVVRCNRYGVARPDSPYLLEREYAILEDAVRGHDLAVIAFGGGAPPKA
jgi:hypothetical protein